MSTTMMTFTRYADVTAVLADPTCEVPPVPVADGDHAAGVVAALLDRAEAVA